jgi:excisionase family DNA binding protein
MEKKFYTVKEVAEILRVAEETIRRGYRDGRIPGRKLPRGRDIRIPVDFVEGSVSVNMDEGVESEE